MTVAGTSAHALGTYYFLLVTHQRPQGLADTVAAVAEQALAPERLVVVDNDAAATDWPALAQCAGGSIEIDYLPQAANLGFAGGLAVGIEHILDKEPDDAWVVISPDDMILPSSDTTKQCLEIANAMLALDPKTAAVGRVGAEIDLRAGRLAKWKRRRPGWAVPIIHAADYIATGPCPMFRLDALRAVGGARAELFIGMTEVELGVRLRRAGFSLYVSRGWPRIIRSVGANAQGPSRAGSPWREYYSTRNFLTIIREHSTRASAARYSLLHGVGRPLWRLVSHPGRANARALAMSVRGVRDGWRGRLGKTVQPEHER